MMATKSTKRTTVIPGFGPTLGYTLFYLSLMVLLPLSSLVFKTTSLTWPEFLATVTALRVVASYRVTFGAALAAAGVNALFGLLVAWVLVRYRLPGKRLIDAWWISPLRFPRPWPASPSPRSTPPTAGSGRSLSPGGSRSPLRRSGSSWP